MQVRRRQPGPAAGKGHLIEVVVVEEHAIARAGAFVSDVWRINRKLTLTLGLRWDKFTAITPHFPGGLANFDPSTGNILLAGLGNVSKSANVYSPNDNFAPRIGFAYQLTSKNVIRAGYGRSYFESGYDATFYHLTSFYPIVAQQSIQQAFREVSDSLIAYRKNQEFRAQEDLLTNSAQDATRLSDIRYRGGVTSYREVSDSDTRYFDAQLGLAQAQLNERLALVQLYNALGGGWQQ